MKVCNVNRSASALIIVLPIIAVLTLIILTVLSMAFFDNRLASNNFAQTQAGNMAKYAMDEVTDKLYQIPLDRHWAAGPGRIVYWDGSSSWSNIDLFSGTNAIATVKYVDGTTAATAANSVKLNVPLPDGSYTIMSTNSSFPTAPDMAVKWVYVLQDGTTTNLATASQPDPSQPNYNPVIGRYGYWTDIENGRVNINTAGFAMVNGPPPAANTPAWTNNPTGRYVFAVESRANTSTAQTKGDTIWTPNPWMTDRMTTTASGVTFANGYYPNPLDRNTAQTNSIQNLTAHPSSIDLSFLDGVSVQKSLDTFRYAGSYFLRVDAKNSYGGSVITPTPNPDISVRFFNAPDDWKLIVDAATYQRNKGYITVRGRSPEINPWGLPKTVLSMTTKDGLALSDLTEYYNRTVSTHWTGAAADAVLDSRLTQVPNIVAPSSASQQRFGVPPYPLVAGTLSFRDLAACNQASSSSNYLAVGALINDLKNVLNPIDPISLAAITLPGFNTSLGAKYNAYGNSGTVGGETEQIAVEMISFVDCCLNTLTSSYPANNTLNKLSLSPYGLTVPMAPAATEALSVRRMGTGGQFLVNEIAMQAFGVGYNPTLWNPVHPPNSVYALTPVAPPSVATSTTTFPKVYYTSISTTQPGILFFMLRQPKDDPTPDANSPDRYVKIMLAAESMTPNHFGFVQPGSVMGSVINMSPEGDIGNTELDYSTDSTDGINGTWTTLNYDVYGYQKPLGSYGTNNADNAAYGGLSTAYINYGSYWALRAGGGAAFNPIANSYAQMAQGTTNYILLGPFDPGTVVSIKIKPRLYFYDTHIYATTMWAIFPGIFPDFTSGVPSWVNPSYLAESSYTTPDPCDPNSTAITSKFLEFDFPRFNVSTSTEESKPLVTNPWASLEATDPRVTRRKTDWKLCTNTQGHTLGDPLGNTTILLPNTVPDTSKVARPPAFLQNLRGLQNASRILGLPGVGYLSEVPTAVDTGILPQSGVPTGTLTKGGAWSTMKFHAIANDSPPDASPPDWLLWNFFYVPFDRSMSNQTDGKLNINARLYPFTDTSGTLLVDSNSVLLREKPLEALLGNRIDPTLAPFKTVAALATAIAQGPTYTNGGKLPGDIYVYAGQICEVPGLADTTTGANEYDREHLSRDLADIVTTQSSDFRVFIVAQTLKQSSTGQIIPVTTQRVEATLSRVVDTGKQGYAMGIYDSGQSAAAAPTTAPYPFNVYLRGPPVAGVPIANCYRQTATGPPVPSATKVDIATPVRNATTTTSIRICAREGSCAKHV